MVMQCLAAVYFNWGYCEVVTPLSSAPTQSRNSDHVFIYVVVARRNFRISEVIPQPSKTQMSQLLSGTVEKDQTNDLKF